VAKVFISLLPHHPRVDSRISYRIFRPVSQTAGTV
jgi:hypothetical protein